MNLHCFKFHWSYSIIFLSLCQMLEKFSGVESHRTVSKLRRENFCNVFTYSIKRAHEIRKFHVTVEQQQLRNVQKACSRAKLFCLSNLLLFWLSHCCHYCCCSLLLWSRNFAATMLKWCHTSPLYDLLMVFLATAILLFFLTVFIELNYWKGDNVG